MSRRISGIDEGAGGWTPVATMPGSSGLPPHRRGQAAELGVFRLLHSDVEGVQAGTYAVAKQTQTCRRMVGLGDFSVIRRPSKTLNEFHALPTFLPVLRFPMDAIAIRVDAAPPRRFRTN